MKVGEPYPRRKSRVVHLGPVAVGGGNPISIQSMNNTRTADVEATLDQLHALAEAGAEIGRLAVAGRQDAEALPQIVARSPLPLVADIHFDYLLALAAIRAGIAGLRINPGNIGGKERVSQVARAAREAGIPIRVGVNGGSLEKDLRKKYGGCTGQALCESALRHVEMLEDNQFFDIKISLKATSLPVMLSAYREIAVKCEYPLHLGVTEAGLGEDGVLKSAMGVGALLSQGIGDTIRVSLTGDPLQEVQAAKKILSLLDIRRQGFSFISCPTCGRTEMDVEGVALAVRRALAEVRPSRPLTIAVMGCAVNGPGEAADADVGIAGGKDCGLLFVKGQTVGKYPTEQLAPALLAAVDKLLQE
ncbi:MAG: flavodoxin-dependent (E)-4-hydroxy-3-methylbut-2-enyl-diphosphate synthase [Firmicutes bacterium]|nr:flavodoxin-dependent (E)-4-hydroxy-3-methylbut-2-enyl-diphosphate synthase [Bacillota bacterium]